MYDTNLGMTNEAKQGGKAWLWSYPSYALTLQFSQITQNTQLADILLPDILAF